MYFHLPKSLEVHLQQSQVISLPEPPKLKGLPQTHFKFSRDFSHVFHLSYTDPAMLSEDLWLLEHDVFIPLFW